MVSDFGENEYFHVGNLETIARRIPERMNWHHKMFPTRQGMSRADVRRSLANDKSKHAQRIVDTRILDLILNELVVQKTLRLVDDFYCLTSFQTTDKAAQEKTEKERHNCMKILSFLNERQPGETTPDFLARKTGLRKNEVVGSLRFLVKEGKLIQLDTNRFLSVETFELLKNRVVDLLSKNPSMYITDIAQALGMSRKAISPLLHYLDSIGVTVREGDLRRLADDNSDLPDHSFSISSRQKTSVFLTMICCLFYSMLSFSACQSSASSSDPNHKNASEVLNTYPANTAPQIVFDSTEFDFGKIVSGHEAKGQFHFKNLGNSNLFIEKVRASCGCTAALASSDRIPPGESGTINFTFNTTGRSGKQRKSVTVTTNDPQNMNVRLEFSADVTVMFGFEPTRLFFGRLHSGKLMEKQLIAIGEKRDTTHILEARIKDENHTAYYRVDIQDQQIEGERSLVISVQPTESIPVGRFNDVLTIKTDNEDTSCIDIPIRGEIIPQKLD